eukprot:CAMPEP_0184369636 /NCGR_PEP_ID=MMETSP1089-20130417/162357_1 /TAXON_ID=38269 ORGANISM="Gloeochaete wittrockiana, Strain SAG46.84" /NCGR_SAMPLE_ID=MMETSP1089 /ASSEMBLY_ACC=CAM_ASM_000445 /LENGTH=404 /DNA_ID=CAMNT_0026712109 /DNA_START=35 /DNA_END=1249 /DNA_ORIENTATION=+
MIESGGEFPKYEVLDIQTNFAPYGFGFDQYNFLEVSGSHYSRASPISSDHSPTSYYAGSGHTTPVNYWNPGNEVFYGNILSLGMESLPVPYFSASQRPPTSYAVAPLPVKHQNRPTFAQSSSSSSHSLNVLSHNRDCMPISSKEFPDVSHQERENNLRPPRDRDRETKTSSERIVNKKRSAESQLRRNRSSNGLISDVRGIPLTSLTSASSVPNSPISPISISSELSYFSPSDSDCMLSKVSSPATDSSSDPNTPITLHFTALKKRLPTPMVEVKSRSKPQQPLRNSRLKWDEPLHQRFLDVINILGMKNSTPKAILKMMGVPGLTRENVASHLQKYIARLKREKGDDWESSFCTAPSSELAELQEAESQASPLEPLPELQMEDFSMDILNDLEPDTDFEEWLR